MEDSFTVMAAKFAGVAAFVWITTEGLPVRTPILGRLTKDARAYVLGTIYSLIAYFSGIVTLNLVHPAMLDSVPAWGHAILTALGVVFLGLAATQAARYGHKIGQAAFSMKDPAP